MTAARLVCVLFSLNAQVFSFLTQKLFLTQRTLCRELSENYPDQRGGWSLKQWAALRVSEPENAEPAAVILSTPGDPPPSASEPVVRNSKINAG